MADNPHDRLFKLALRQADNARAYLSALLPASVIAALDLSRLESEPTDLVSERLRELFSELVYKIPLAGGDAYICTLLEHQSTREPMMPLRFLKAVVSIWTDLLQNEPARMRLPPILSILVHNGEHPWRSPRTLWELYEPGAALLAPLRACLPELHYLVDDLRAESPEGLESRPAPPYLRLALMSLQSRGEDPPAPQLPNWGRVISRPLADWKRDRGGGDLAQSCSHGG